MADISTSVNCISVAFKEKVKELKTIVFEEDEQDIGKQGKRSSHSQDCSSKMKKLKEFLHMEKKIKLNSFIEIAGGLLLTLKEIHSKGFSISDISKNNDFISKLRFVDEGEGLYTVCVYFKKENIKKEVTQFTVTTIGAQSTIDARIHETYTALHQINKIYNKVLSPEFKGDSELKGLMEKFEQQYQLFIKFYNGWKKGGKMPGYIIKDGKAHIYASYFTTTCYQYHDQSEAINYLKKLDNINKENELNDDPKSVITQAISLYNSERGKKENNIELAISHLQAFSPNINTTTSSTDTNANKEFIPIALYHKSCIQRICRGKQYTQKQNEKRENIYCVDPDLEQAYNMNVNSKEGKSILEIYAGYAISTNHIVSTIEKDEDINKYTKFQHQSRVYDAIETMEKEGKAKTNMGEIENDIYSAVALCSQDIDNVLFDDIAKGTPLFK